MLQVGVEWNLAIVQCFFCIVVREYTCQEVFWALVNEYQAVQVIMAEYC